LVAFFTGLQGGDKRELVLSAHHLRLPDRLLSRQISSIPVV